MNNEQKNKKIKDTKQYCTLSNLCNQYKYKCCYFCSVKSCQMRCKDLEHYTSCKYLTSTDKATSNQLSNEVFTNTDFNKKSHKKTCLAERELKEIEQVKIEQTKIAKKKKVEENNTQKIKSKKQEINK